MGRPPGEVSGGVLEAGRAAIARHAWQDAFDILSGADHKGLLAGAGLRMLAEAAWWSGQPEMVLAVGERAYEAFQKEGDQREAAMMAYELAEQYAIRLAWPVAMGWLSRAEHLVDDDADAPAHAYFAIMRGHLAASSSTPDAAIALYDEAQSLARRGGDRNAEIRAMLDKGRALCGRGDIAAGASLMDEAMVAAVGGELDPLPAGIVYCTMIAACSQLGDYARAAEWTEATTRWCERHAISGFPGVCRVHRAEIMRLRGAWPVAEEEARRACEELPKFNLFNGLGFAYYEIGEVRRRMGDVAGAEQAYARAHEYGRDPEPGLSLLRLAQGDLAAAAAGVRRILADETWDRLGRVHPLAAQVPIALAAADLETASAAAEELQATAQQIGTTAMRAIADSATGAVQLAAGDAGAALAPLRRGLRAWQEINAPYEVAEVRVLLGRAYRALGDRDGARQELRAAADAYERLGAAWAAERARAEPADAGASPAPQRVRRAFLFSDIVKSTDLVAAIGDEAWEDLLRWHDQTLRELFTASGGEVAHHTGDGFFVAFPDAVSAVSAAVAIQRALADHRRRHGFALSVRIGVHCAEATRRAQDYSGQEVHKAARVAGLAGGGQILVTEEVARELPATFGVAPVREAALKGFAEAVKVAGVTWR